MKTDYMVLINSANPMPEGYEDTVERITVQNCVGTQYEVEKKTYEAFLRLQKDVLENDGIQTDLISAYRTVASQTASYNYYMETMGPEYTNTYVAKPGHSEHHTGIAIDVGILVDGKLLTRVEDLLKVDHLFHIIHAKLSKYGFILRYPKGKEAITGIGYECWHFRYIDSPEIANAIAQQGLCFEEYWQTK